MSAFAEVVVNVPQVSGSFHYHLPPELQELVRPGLLVEVPFGQQTVQGVVVRLLEQADISATRPVLAIVDEAVVLTPAQIGLAQELARASLSPLSACIGLMLPPGLEQMADTRYQLLQPPASRGGSVQQRLVALLVESGPLRGRQIDRHFSAVDWRTVARSLVRSGVLASQSVLPPPSIRPKLVRTVALACPPAQAAAALAGLTSSSAEAQRRRQAALSFLLREPGPVEVTWVYAESGAKLDDLVLLAERGLVHLSESQAWRDPLAGQDISLSSAPVLTSDQQTVWQALLPALRAAAGGEEQQPFLLHGVTGSGKTEIYLAAVAEVLQQGRQALLLVPEIAMTPQTVQRVLGRFPGQVGLVHSQLSLGERYDTWRRVQQGRLGLVVGPRSALFLPFPNLGLIVLDESHDDSYYNDSPPAYHARQAAVIYARLSRAVCLFGSATPDLSSRYRAEVGEWRYLSLPRRILGHPAVTGAPAAMTELPPVQVVDMRQELKAGNRSIFSRAMQNALQQTLAAGQQAILFLNRRGAATYVFCRDCGLALKCPHCDIPLTAHGDLPQAASQALLCHRCGYTRQMPRTCPTCRSPHIRQYGAGTEKVEDEVRSLLPKARLLRWDQDTARRKGAHELILTHFSSGHADVLIGTQMVAKGLDLPRVTFVGVVLADVGLNLPDLRAGERTFQLLTQVAGRAGRSPLGGRVVLQTFMPEHYVIQAAAGHDYSSFYRQELALRRSLGYPPFSRLLRLEYRHSDPAKAEAEAQQMALQLDGWLQAEGRSATERMGPTPCFFAQVGGVWRWQIVLRGPDPAAVLRGRRVDGWRLEVDPPSLL